MTATGSIDPVAIGRVVTFYPRAGKPGHPVVITDLRRHPLHGMIVAFRYIEGGRTQERTWGKFFTSPE